MAAPTTPNYPTSNPALSEVITDSTPATPEFHANIHDQIALEVNEIGADLIAAKGGIGAGSMTSKIAAMDASIAAAALKASNLSDLASASTARTNLGLGGAAVLNVGTTAGTVAAGNDARFGSGGSVVGASPYVYVASSTATPAQQAAADYLCDGTNDEVTIQTAIQYAGDNGINHIKLSSGTFNIGAAGLTGGLNVINLCGPNAAGTAYYSNMKIEGSGSSHSLQTSQTGGGTRLVYVGLEVGSVQPIFKIQGAASDPSTSRLTRYVVQNLSIDGKGTGSGHISGIHVQWVNVFYISDIQISGCRGYGMYMNGASDGTVERVRFDYCGQATTSAVPATSGLMISDNIASWTSDNIAFRDCWWENGMSRHVSLTSEDTGATSVKGVGYTFTVGAGITANLSSRAVYSATTGGPFTITASYVTGNTSIVATTNNGTAPPAAPATLTLVSGTGPTTISYTAISAAAAYLSRQQIYRITFDRCKFEQQYTTGGASNALLSMDAVMQLSITNCYFYADLAGTSVLAAPEVAGNQPGAFLRLRSCYAVNISDNHFVTGGTTGTVPPTAYAIWVDRLNAASTNFPAVMDGINIENNYFDISTVAAKKWNANCIVWQAGLSGANIENASRSGNYASGATAAAQITVESKTGAGAVGARVVTTIA